MDRLVLTEMLEVENTHWWYCARRQIVRAVLQRFAAPAGEVLEIGCGGGGNLAMLEEFGPVRAVELDDEARAAAELRHPGILKGWLPDGMPFDETERFSRIALLDVIEHVEDDRAALRRVRELLLPSGLVIISTPAHQWLWRRQDDLNHHYRRYTRAEVREKLETAGFEVVFASYYNSLLFPLMIAVIFGQRLIGREQTDDNRVPRRWVNAVLRDVFALERLALRHGSQPVGASVLAVGRRRGR